MTRRIAIALTLAVSLPLGLAAGASARVDVHRLHPQPRKLHTASVPAPSISSVAPLKANVGQKLTVLGKNFRSGKGHTRVFFLRQGGGIASASAEFATKSRLVVTIPDTVTPLLRGSGRTRFQLRILTSRYGDPTKMTKSPLIGPASTHNPGGGTGGGAPCKGQKFPNAKPGDTDGDLIPDKVEIATTHTDPCAPDTDGDGISDGYEWQAAKDMNEVTPFNVPNAALPFPGKKPWPNPLDAGDANYDHDGDGLTMADEYQLFKFYGHNTLPLNYSDGKQASAQVLAPTALTRLYMDNDHNGILSDDERDADGDGLGNWDEKYGRMTQSWWDSEFSGQGGLPMESHYYMTDSAGGSIIDFAGTSMTDPDTDGDGIPDGADDQDHDGLSNAFEISRPWDWMATYVSFAHDGPVPSDYISYTPAPGEQAPKLPGILPDGVGPNPWARVQPYNPCKPVWSATCHKHPAFGYYGQNEDWAAPAAPGAPPAAPWLYDVVHDVPVPGGE